MAIVRLDTQAGGDRLSGGRYSDNTGYRLSQWEYGEWRREAFGPFREKLRLASAADFTRTAIEGRYGQEYRGFPDAFLGVFLMVPREFPDRGLGVFLMENQESPD